jgi:hypothetical protein
MNSSLLIRTVLILGCIFILFALISHYNRAERFQDPAPAPESGKCPGLPGIAPASSDKFRPVDASEANKLPTDCMPRDKITAEDLLPKDAANSKWAQVNPAGQGSVGDQNFLSAGYHVGVDTQMSSMKIANYDLRPSPVIEQKQVSPWNQSTVMPDVSIKSLS